MKLTNQHFNFQTYITTDYDMTQEYMGTVFWPHHYRRMCMPIWWRSFFYDLLLLTPFWIMLRMKCWWQTALFWCL